MESYQKERINRGIEATQPFIDIIKSYDINNLANNLPNMFEQIEKKAEENDLIFSKAGINKLNDEGTEYSSLVAYLVFEKLLDLGYDGIAILTDCIEIIENDEIAKNNAHEKSIIKQFLEGVKKKNHIDEKLTEESIQKLNGLLYRYYRNNNYIENFKLEDNIFNIVVSFFKESIDARKKDIRKYLAKSDIKMDLTSLGFEDIYQDILLELCKFYKMDLVNSQYTSNTESKKYNEVESEIEYIEPTMEEELEALEIRKRISFTQNDINIEEPEKTPDGER